MNQDQLLEVLGLSHLGGTGLDVGYSIHVSSGNKKNPELLAITWIFAKD